MPDLDEIPLSITARLDHQVDFAFLKNNVDIANDLREQYLTAGSFGGAASLREIKLDADNDVTVRTNRGTWYITERSVMVVGQPATLKSLSAEYLDEVGKTVEWLFKLRDRFPAEWYEISLLFWQRSVSKHRLEGLEKRCSASLKSLLGDAAPPEFRSFRLLSRFKDGPFKDSIELDVSKDVELRFSRESNASNFNSYGEFLRESNMAGAVSGIRPLLDVFVVDNPPPIAIAR